uniref:Uncharacterized protein n=1 Tax=Nelumbo nucifera TaxID=4432 RepID=A0A822YSZ7_NELNU|nr:TPA_asm: hypothetical protein HUJ06_007895 [Nelumbo nucifera]
MRVLLRPIVKGAEGKALDGGLVAKGGGCVNGGPEGHLEGTFGATLTYGRVVGGGLTLGNPARGGPRRETGVANSVDIGNGGHKGGRPDTREKRCHGESQWTQLDRISFLSRGSKMSKQRHGGTTNENFQMSLSLLVAAMVNYGDNTGAKNLYIISVNGI